MSAESNVFDAPELTLASRRLRQTDVRPGDLLFCRRPGLLTVMNRTAGDAWRHVGIVANLDAQLVLVEVDHHGLGARCLDLVAESYDLIGVATLALEADERERLSSLAASDIGTRLRYPWGTVFVTGLRAEVRRWVPAARPALRRIDRAIVAQRSTPRLLGGLTCSGYVAERVACVVQHSVTGATPNRLAMPQDLWSDEIVSQRRLFCAPTTPLSKRTTMVDAVAPIDLHRRANPIKSASADQKSLTSAQHEGERAS